MNVLNYLKDKKYLIAFYVFLIVFISSTIYLSSNSKKDIDNILYINFVSTIFFIIYLTCSYIRKKVYYSYISEVVENSHGDIINQLPEPKNYEQKLYNKLLKVIHEQQMEKIEMLYEDKKENQEFITSWVHEIKTPISVVRLIIENNNKSSDEILNSIEDEVDKIENQVENVLYYSRIDDFSKDYFINEISLNKIVKEAVKRHAKIFINKKIKIEIDNKEMDIMTDKKWLFFIISQILSNSLKYTDVNGKVIINFEEDNKEKRLIIKDNGIGIKKEDIERVFNKGFTGHTGRQSYKSTGMGLYLAKKLCRKLGHDISIESLYGEYTKVSIHFPKINNYLNVTKM